MTERDESNAAVCPNCGSADVVDAIWTDRFPYGVAPHTVELSATVSGQQCRSCGLRYYGEAGENARHDAICHHLRLLPPAAIAEVRARYKLSRAKFAAASRIGVATLSRWETGELMQNAALDLYMRLLSRPDIFEMVRSDAVYRPAPTDAVERVEPRPPRFRVITGSAGFDALKARGRGFDLCGPQAATG